MINRVQLDFAKNRLFKDKALIIYGPRQAGKTTFVKLLLADSTKKVLEYSGDEIATKEILQPISKSFLQIQFEDAEIILIDEAQKIPNIGDTIKIIVDQLKDIQVIVTGSSSFELANKINEALTGRKYEMLLLPTAFAERVSFTNFKEEHSLLETRMLYGTYPEIVANLKQAKEHIKLISNSYLYKDLLALGQIKKPYLLENLVKLLALQVGSEVNVFELSKILKSDSKTIEKYIDVLVKGFVIFEVNSFSKNLRNEIGKGRKIYFYDNGIINAISGNFSPINHRNDVGALWENFLMSERKKWLNNNRIDAQMFFWRTTQQQEIDYVEVTHDRIKAFEFKWNMKKTPKLSKTFSNAYPAAEYQVINPTNYFTFLA